MLDIAILFLALFISYALFRSRGGDGFTVKARLHPISTPKGKEDRLVVGAALIISLSALAFIFIQDGRISTLILPLVIGAAVVLIPLVLKKNK